MGEVGFTISAFYNVMIPPISLIVSTINWAIIPIISFVTANILTRPLAPLAILIAVLVVAIGFITPQTIARVVISPMVTILPFAIDGLVDLASARYVEPSEYYPFVDTIALVIPHRYVVPD